MGDLDARVRSGGALQRGAALGRSTGCLRCRSSRGPLRNGPDGRWSATSSCSTASIASVDTEAAGLRLLQDERAERSSDPHFHIRDYTRTEGPSAPRSRSRLCGDRRGRQPDAPDRRCSATTTRAERALEGLGLSVRPARRGSERLALRDGIARTWPRSSRVDRADRGRARMTSRSGPLHAWAPSREDAATRCRSCTRPRSGRAW